MVLDGVLLVPGQSVFDIALGPGTVAIVTGNLGVQVNFPRGQHAYDAQGVGPFRTKTLYVVPPEIVNLAAVAEYERHRLRQVIKAVATQFTVT